MSNMHLVTGYAGLPHVTAADMASLYAALFGHGSYVLDRGNRFAATVVTNNSISIASGDLLLQGRHVRIEDGTTVELTIENGTSGNKRSDLIVARYTRNSSTGVEEVNLVVLKGTQTTGTPADPDYTPGDIIQDKALVADVPLYRIPLDGLTVGTPVRLFEVKRSVEKQIHDQFLDAAPLDHSASTTKYGVGSASKYGHVKLSDATNQDSGADTGVAATPAAVNAVRAALADVKAATEIVQTVANAATAYTSGSATRTSSNTTGGTVKYCKCGRLVQVNINNLGLKISAINASTWKEYTVATGLPKPALATAYEHLYIEAAQSNAGRFQVKSDGSLIFYHHDTDLVRGGTEDTAAASGVITYISAT